MTQIIKIQNNTTIAVLGTARNEHVRATLRKLDAPGVRLVAVVKEERLSDFTGYSFDTHGFKGKATADNKPFLETIRAIGADQIVVVTGETYCHDLVVAAFDAWAFSGLLEGYQLYLSYPDESPLNDPSLVAAGVGPTPLQQWPDPTKVIPPGYCSHKRAEEVVENAFLTCCEYLQRAGPRGEVVEFGVYKGSTARMLATMMARLKLTGGLHLYDSFEGFPKSDHPADSESYEIAKKKIWLQGDMRLPDTIVEDIRRALGWILPLSRISITKGFYEKTLLSSPPPSNIALVHIDCDLYLSAKTVLDALLAGECFADGAVLMLDDYNCNQANSGMGERRALREAFATQNRYVLDPWFYYGWHGRTFFVHDSASAPSS